MSALKILNSAVTKLFASTKLVATHANVMKDIKEMDSIASVSYIFVIFLLVIIYYVTCHADINECLMGDEVCDSYATCENTPGSFICICDHGYEKHNNMCTCWLQYLLHE